MKRILPPFVDLESQAWLNAPSPAELHRKIDALGACLVFVACAAVLGWALVFWLLFTL